MTRLHNPRVPSPCQAKCWARKVFEGFCLGEGGDILDPQRIYLVLHLRPVVHCQNAG
jgi:hypothetical protein